MKKKLLTILLGSALILGMATGCTTEKSTNGDADKQVEEQAKGNCKVEECINQIEPKMKLEEVNELIGFEGEKKEDSDTYVWQLTKKTKIEVEYKDGLGSIKATYDKDEISNDDLKLATFHEILGDMNKNKAYTYEEIVEKLGGIEGHLESKLTSGSKMYKWVKDGQTFRVTFDGKTGKSSISSLR